MSIEDFVVSKDKNKFFIKDCSKCIFYNLNDIFYIKSDCNYSYICTKQNEYILLCSLKEIQRKLPDYFFRSHKSYIVNMHKFKEIKSAQNSCFVILENEKEIPLSRRRKNCINNFF